jgi:hypothetical protein
MDAELKAKWVAALRSGTYTQGTGELHTPSEKSFCCLGVLCEVAQIEYTPGWAALPDDTLLAFKIQNDLSDKNDGDGVSGPMTFAEIADYIEANL